MMSRSPQTPRHSRQSSAIDTRFQTPSPNASPDARRLSKSSFQDPLTPLRNSMNETELSMLGNGGLDQGNGLGNLADELADAFSDSEEEYDEEEDDGEGEESEMSNTVPTPTDEPALPARTRTVTLNAPEQQNVRAHRREASAYDGSEYGSETDLDMAGMPPSLVAKIDAVETLARRGTDSLGNTADPVFKRVTDGLRDLGSQSSVEGNTTRLITAHSALSTHLTHQTRQIHNLTFPLLSPLVAPPDPETIDELLPLLASVADDMPRPATAALSNLAALHTVTADLVQTLNYLSDTLHMSRQTTTTATRRLRTAKELVAEMKREEELREEGERWLTRGNWSDRLEKRECAGVCRDVVGGFEEVCNGWRARLMAQAESA
ncbi:uncharacterized protein B0I36DRAFT_100766 [Microdochium trichocladiopsis]|uniref:Uncharacterized protein n=1 Tax=Microdochium trichocladiopsis TaxID=1682393 RepID=A0A9P9BRE0_9PEZI|nr:uncharacterized protein B0I36DRAFT_100766 [Microdochium trichocladiopsis]KAH7032801.1 hypothetical protein B0I36DRAFT_100766 [Microdochium trichocladiopsis]